ncbi:MAG: hypothetical protein C4297_03695 [Gemmataceae bacterium]
MSQSARHDAGREDVFPTPLVEAILLYCRLHLPWVHLTTAVWQQHLRRMYERSQRHQASAPGAFLRRLFALDAYLVAGLLERQPEAWQVLFALRMESGGRLLVDALRAQALRLYPRDREKQESAVQEFWSHLLVAPEPGGQPILMRYDGLRPLLPWLVRVFHNLEVSRLRAPYVRWEDLPDSEWLPAPVHEDQPVWRETFHQAVREWVASLGERDLLLLGLLFRYQISQRRAAELLGVHEGTVSRQVARLREHAHRVLEQRLARAGWSGEDVTPLILAEMAGVLLEEPALTAEALAAIFQRLRRQPFPAPRGP